MNHLKRPTICFVLTSPLALNAFILNHLAALSDENFVTVCINTSDAPISQHLDKRVEIIHVSIARKIAPWQDLWALFSLVRLMQLRHFDAVHSLMPKSGLLAMVAARVVGIRSRSHIFTGQVWATRRGGVRWLLKTMDRLLAKCATDLLADSHSQARFLENEGICSSGRIQVLGAGSVCGVDLKKFVAQTGRRDMVRTRLGVPPESTLFLYLGRLQREKGVLILAEAFAALAKVEANSHVLWVGPDEDDLSEHLSCIVEGRSHLVGFTDSPQDYLDSADVLVLPSFREGFGTVVIEAAAMGKPAIASRIYGLSDAVIEEQTGLLFNPGDVDDLKGKMQRLLTQDARQLLGVQAQQRVFTEFSSDHLTGLWLDFFSTRLGGA